MKKENRGGARGNAGRKPLPEEDKTTPITLYVKNSAIEANGGVESARKLAKKMLERKKVTK